MFPVQPRFNFNDQAMHYVKVLFSITLLGIFISSVAGFFFAFPSKIVLIRSLDLFTDSIPPALPAVLSFGIIIALNRFVKYMSVINAVSVVVLLL